jgi:allophanate hydrolase subunit 2
VPEGAVGIAAGYTGIYPFPSAGGFHLIGRAVGFRAFDADGARLAIGDRVRFVVAQAHPHAEVHVHDDVDVREPLAEITKLAGFAVVVDRGRFGHMHEGVPWSGPLVPEAFARANHAAGNDEGAAAIEISGNLEITARGEITIADDLGGGRILRDGETLSISSRGARVRYLALGGGIDIAPILGSRTTLLAARFGRALRKGDRFSASTRAPRALSHLDGDDAPILLEPGVIGGIFPGRFRISPRSDRTGTRLEGPPITIPRELLSRRSMPMILGAIEATPSGLIVLGPDHPTTGGYPLAGVLPPREAARLFARPLGAHVDLHMIPAIRLDGARDPH